MSPSQPPAAEKVSKPVPVGMAEKVSKPVPVGIDLGTTYSLIAHLDPQGRPVSIPNGLGEVLTPSAVLFEDDEVVVGRQAVKASMLSPDRFQTRHGARRLSPPDPRPGGAARSAQRVCPGAAET